MSTDASDVIYQYPQSDIQDDLYIAFGSFVTGTPDADLAKRYDRASTAASVARTLAEKLNAQYLDVRDFGATGDGVTDDTAALRAVFDARFAGTGWGKTSATGSYPEVWGDGWKVILIPPGTYRLSRAISVRSKTVVFAYGAILKALPVNATDPETVWVEGYWDARTTEPVSTTKSGIGHLGGILSIRHAQNVYWHGGTLDGNDILIRAGFNGLGISAPLASKVSAGERIVVRDLQIRRFRNNMVPGLNDIFVNGGGKAFTIQLGQSEIILQNLLIDDCDFVGTIEGTSSNGRGLRQVVVDTLMATDCKYGFVIHGTTSQMDSSCDLRNVWLRNVGNNAHDGHVDGTTYANFIDDKRRIGGVLTLQNANNLKADIRITNDNTTGLGDVTGKSDLIRGTARNTQIRIKGYVAHLNHLWNATLPQQDARVSSLTIIHGGTGYTAGPLPLSFTNDSIGGGPASHQTATIAVDGSGSITEINLSDQALFQGAATLDTGKGYQRPPTVTAGGSGTGAVFTPVMNYAFAPATATGGVFDCLVEAELEVGQHHGLLVKHLPHVRPTGLDIRATIRSTASFTAPVSGIYDYEPGDPANIQGRNRFEIVVRNLQKVIRGRFDRQWDAAAIQALEGPIVELGGIDFNTSVQFDSTIDNRFINRRVTLPAGTPTVVVNNTELPAGFRGLVIVSSLGLSYQHTALLMKSEVNDTLVMVPLGAGTAYTLALDANKDITVTSTSTATQPIASRVVVVPFDASTH
ncbi:glycosyl hydrolase family 28-related protein [Tistrella mobilis]